MIPEADKLQIRRKLEEARHEIVDSCALREEVRIEQAADAMDQVQAAEQRELAIRNLDRSARRFHQIESALRRLDAGDYGTCANCEEEIGPNRLRAVPWTQLCLKCQELADQSEFADRSYDAADLLSHAA